MPKFGDKSLQELNTCDIRLQRVAHEVIKKIDFSVTDGHRGEKEQNESYAKHRSTKTFPNSKHNKYPSPAFDALPYPIDYEMLDGKKGAKLQVLAWARMGLLAGLIIAEGEKQGVKIKWGADWDMDGELADHTFTDGPHYEIVEQES